MYIYRYIHTYTYVYITRLECSKQTKPDGSLCRPKKNTWKARSRLEYWWISCRIRLRDDDRDRPATGDRVPGLCIYIYIYTYIYIYISLSMYS